jgi:hypothetical protein
MRVHRTFTVLKFTPEGRNMRVHKPYCFEVHTNTHHMFDSITDECLGVIDTKNIEHPRRLASGGRIVKLRK